MNTAIAAVVTNGVVENIIVVEVDENDDPAFELEGSDVVVVPSGVRVAIGATYSNGNFTNSGI